MARANLAPVGMAAADKAAIPAAISCRDVQKAFRRGRRVTRALAEQEAQQSSRQRR
jgi:hypothetical protein